jgi:general stress protein 26
MVLCHYGFPSVRRRNPARWRAIEARLGRELTIWLATTRHDGRPHLTPLWFVWLEGKIYIATGAATQKFINMYSNQNVALALPDTANVVLIEGEAHVANRATVDALADYFYHKYEWDFRYDESAEWRLIEITPHKILAWGDGYEAEGTRVL